jgi:hypothetical protein
MRKRISSLHSVVAYESKNKLRSIDFNDFTTNYIDGGTPAFLRKLNTPVNSYQDWPRFIAEAMSIDETTLRIMTYIAHHRKHVLEYKIIKLSYTEICKHWQGKPLSQDAFYLSIKALLFIQAIAKASADHGPAMYHINSLFFEPTPNKQFRVNTYFQPQNS